MKGEAVPNSPNSGGARRLAPAVFAAPTADASALTESQGAQLFTPRAVGFELEADRRELVACGQELQAAAPFQGRSFFDDSLQLLRRLACRIAVIGQVKAGKSSFINAFVGRPGLLPTDVNPWTTAVTHLHFGCADTPTNVAAQFTFFDTGEWEHLVHGGGHIRELTQRLVPGFEVELLQKHVDAMRSQSEQRLGPVLPSLLGQKHSFPSISTEILERYVCSGVPGSREGQKGAYADVVKAADLYFTGKEFGMPTTIIDTPGTNDPFLVRDEITRRALETADVYIVMLTARQALSSADVALLRILRGLRKDRILVFINRIDDLGDVVRDTPSIVEQVNAGLRREFPTSQIPVIAGSALWAKMAISGSDADIDRALTRKMKAYAAQLAEPAGEPQSDAGSSRKEQNARALLLCSGFSVLPQALANLAVHSRAGHVLKQICRSFCELGQVGRNATLQAVDLLEAEEKSILSRQQQGIEELRAIDAEVSKNEQLTVALGGLLVDLQSRTDQVIDEHCSAMLEVFHGAVSDFSQDECENLRRAIADGQRRGVWRCETTALRQRLEECLIGSFRAAEQDLGKLAGHVFPRLQQLLIRHYPQWKQTNEAANDPIEAELPSLGALSQMVALDLGEPWWKGWWATRRNADEQVAELDRLVHDEFYPVADELVHATRAQLKAQQSAVLQKSTSIYMGLVEFLQEQNKARLARTRVLISAGDAFRKDELRRGREARVADLKRQVPIMERLLGRLENLDRAWAEKIG